MRERYQTNKTSKTWKYDIYNVFNGQRTGGDTGTTTKDNYDFDFISDEVTPFFERRRRNGEIIMNSLSSAKSRVYGVVGPGNHITQTYQLQNGIWVLIGSDSVVYQDWQASKDTGFTSVAELFQTHQPSIATTMFNLAELTNLESSLMTNARANAASSDALAAVTLAELDKTYDMFASGAKMTWDLVNRLDHVPLAWIKDLARMSYRDIKRLARSYGKKTPRGLREAAAMWLGYRYGIMATYYDAASWVTAGKRLGSKGRGRFTSTVHTEYRPNDITSSVNSQFTVIDTLERFSRSTVSTAGVLIQATPSLSASDTFGGLNVLSTAWELVPYSFVIDWFADVGKRLAALEGSVLRPVLGSWITHRSNLYHMKSKTYYNRSYVDGQGLRRVGIDYEKLNSTTTEVCTLVQRVANPTVSYIPAINVKLNAQRVLDGISLLGVSSAKLRRLIR